MVRWFISRDHFLNFLLLFPARSRIGGAQPRPPAPASEEDERRESRQEPLIETGAVGILFLWSNALFWMLILQSGA